MGLYSPRQQQQLFTGPRRISVYYVYYYISVLPLISDDNNLACVTDNMQNHQTTGCLLKPHVSGICTTMILDTEVTKKKMLQDLGASWGNMVGICA